LHKSYNKRRFSGAEIEIIARITHQGSFMRISVKVRTALLRDVEVPDGSHSIHEFSAFSLFNQVALTTSNEGMRPVDFFPNPTTIVQVAGSRFSLYQDGIEFASGRATFLTFDIHPRSMQKHFAL